MGLFTRKRTAAPATAAPAGSRTAAPVDPALAALTGDYTIDPAHSSIGFTVRHAMVTNVKGSFAEHEGGLHLDGSDPSRSTASLDVRIESVDTGIKDRDAHLRGEDFFDAGRFPLMTFRSTAAEQLGGDRYRLTGDLTIKDVTRPLAIDLEFNGSATDVYGNERVGFEGGAEILRSDWGLTWNAALETGGVMVSDKVKLTFDISAVKSAPQA
ncbi:polyisoprenoid-binding protein [Streptomyces eurocidicus]|uniref:Polyisoprenoid-binding protein n=1 Tax=Streptomyces eurocidicus TaxID=66423 RepID=A0A2N8NNY4_STREU|nr:YceI family protein [Streptomyces eurocidicus]MBB5116772.1 polyisoprenoid-binding protein YceI [Streptomyces eurocidicus]MBF6052226.1 polyisoprenoid-binding protein [Streptomyces eurocidicus]PNE30480.1 polyisoprenoid-binding protein [Streptomyces eurocidicus]